MSSSPSEPGSFVISNCQHIDSAYNSHKQPSNTNKIHNIGPLRALCLLIIEIAFPAHRILCNICWNLVEIEFNRFYFSSWGKLMRLPFSGQTVSKCRTVKHAIYTWGTCRLIEGQTADECFLVNIMVLSLETIALENYPRFPLGDLQITQLLLCHFSPNRHWYF